MKKFLALSLVGSSFFLSGIIPAQANDFVVPKGEVYTQNDSDTIGILLDQDGNTYTTLEEFDCTGDTFYASNTYAKTSALGCYKLLINKHNALGKSVAATAAMNTAMTAVPESSPNAKHTCGIGTGGNSGTFAVSAGCSSNISDRLSINTGGSIALADSQDYGSGNIDNYGIKVGFLYKFGSLEKQNLVSNNALKELEKKFDNLAKNNKQIQEQNELLKEMIAIQDKKLQSLENIALENSKSKDLAVYKLK